MRDFTSMCESREHARGERVSTVVVLRDGEQTSACAVGAPLAMALAKAALNARQRIPMKGGDEMTLVQPEGVPTPNRAVVSRDTGEVVGRRPEPMTGPTAQAGCGQTPQGESNRCQGQLIVTPAAGNTARGAHDAPSADDPYAGCSVYLEHGACVCSTGYPATCTADECPSGGPHYWQEIDPRDRDTWGQTGVGCAECGKRRDA